MAPFGSTPKTEAGLDSAVSTARRARDPILFDHIECFYKRSGLYPLLGFLAPGGSKSNQTSSTGLRVKLRDTFLR